RTGNGMTPFPVTAGRRTPGGDGPRLEYTVTLFTAGEVRVTAYLSPRNNVFATDGLAYAISIDDAEPQIVNITKATGADDTAMNRQWQQNTSDYINVTRTVHTVGTPGVHTLKFWMVDPTVVVQLLMVDTGGLLDSYLGPPEILRSASYLGPAESLRVASVPATAATVTASSRGRRSPAAASTPSADRNGPRPGNRAGPVYHRTGPARGFAVPPAVDLSDQGTARSGGLAPGAVEGEVRRIAVRPGPGALEPERHGPARRDARVVRHVLRGHRGAALGDRGVPAVGHPLAAGEGEGQVPPVDRGRAGVGDGDVGGEPARPLVLAVGDPARGAAGRRARRRRGGDRRARLGGIGAADAVGELVHGEPGAADPRLEPGLHAGADPK